MVSFKRLGRKYLDFEFPVRDQARLRIIERPGRWMRGADLERLVDEMRQVVRTVVPEGVHYGVLTGDKHRLDNALIAILYERRSHRPIAFNAFAYLEVELHGRPVDVLHLGLIMVDPECRAKGYSWLIVGLPCLLVFLRSGLQPVWITSVSQVPAVCGAVARGFTGVYPSPFAASGCTFTHLSIARQVMERHRAAFGAGPQAQFDEDRFVIRDGYAPGVENLKKTFERVAKHRDERVNDACRRSLDYARGDDFLQVGSIDFACTREYLLRSVPRDSLPSVLYRATFVLLGGLVVPLVHWFLPRRQWGDLRPWRS